MIRFRLGARHAAAAVRQGRTWAWGSLLAVLLATSWAVVYSAGGTRTAWPHVFYFPIVVAALPFGTLGAAIVALIGAWLCGPIMPIDTATGAPQELHNWLVRGAFFLGVGLVSGATSAARARASALQLLSTQDPLTGIANRRRLDDTLDRQLAEADRHGHPLSVILFDLDHFKRVNDTYGHAFGDRVLQAVVRRVSTALRAGDELGRWGGEEFLIIAPHADLREAERIAQRCRLLIRGTPVGAVTVTASFGVATRDTSETARSLLHRADEALYAAKASGRDQTRVGMSNGTSTGDGGIEPRQDSL